MKWLCLLGIHPRGRTMDHRTVMRRCEECGRSWVCRKRVRGLAQEAREIEEVLRD